MRRDLRHHGGVDEHKGIFVDYISFNWVRGKPLDPEKNPLHRGLAQELARHGLDFSMLCEMANKKFTWTRGRYAKDSDNYRADSTRRVSSVALDGAVRRDSGEVPRVETEEENEKKNEKNKDFDSKEHDETQGTAKGAVDRCIATDEKRPSFPMDEWFALFWKTYPNTCPRKVDRKKCRDKFLRIISEAKERGERKFKDIMAGLERWLRSEMWNGDGGRFIKAPLVWLNGSCWEDTPMKGNGNGDISRQGTRGCDNSFSSALSQSLSRKAIETSRPPPPARPARTPPLSQSLSRKVIEARPCPSWRAGYGI